MTRFLSLTGILMLLLITACTSPCTSVSELACKTAGNESRECLEMKNFAHEATDQDQKVCKHILELTNQLKPQQ